MYVCNVPWLLAAHGTSTSVVTLFAGIVYWNAFVNVTAMSA
jgi:hypothetical protein